METEEKPEEEKKPKKSRKKRVVRKKLGSNDTPLKFSPAWVGNRPVYVHRAKEKYVFDGTDIDEGDYICVDIEGTEFTLTAAQFKADGRLLSAGAATVRTL